jgi:hypothetical protein
MSGELQLKTGALASSLLRNRRQIVEERAIGVFEDAELVFKRKKEDLEKDIKKLIRARDAKLDLSPSNATSMILAENFNADKFMVDDLEISKEIRQKTILLAIVTARYNYLFQGSTEQDAPLADDEPTDAEQ